MVFKPIHLARQSFLKTFTHGYAQSIVAASQSSSASQNNTFHNLGTNVVNFFRSNQNSSQQHLQSLNYAYQSASAQAGPGAKAGHGANANYGVDGSVNDGGLAAYYAAWQSHQRNDEHDKEGNQFQFAKRVGWKAPTTILEPRLVEKPPVDQAVVEDRPKRAALTRSASTSAIDQIAAEEFFNVDQDVQQSHPSIPRAEPAALSPPLGDSAEDASSVDVKSTDATSQSSSSDVFTEQLTALAEKQHYGDIPAVFERMLVDGVRPTASSYNALLLAAINLTRGTHHVVPKALDVYSDMLRRRVAPDTSTYAILVELLAARALEVSSMKQSLLSKQIRYGGMDQEGSFLLRSDESEYRLLTEDDSLSRAIKLFDTAAAVGTSHVFPTETYRLLICACADSRRVSDMVRVYAHMESQDVIPPTAIFPSMIQAFASTGDLRSSVECYDEYKALAISHDLGKKTIVRKDEDVYAAVVKAYAMCDRLDAGMRFFDKIHSSLPNEAGKALLTDIVYGQALIPKWLSANSHVEAIAQATEKLSPEAQRKALALICIDAADKNVAPVAVAAFNRLGDATPYPGVAEALLAMHVRMGDVPAAAAVWSMLQASQSPSSLVEPTCMYAIAHLGRGDLEHALQESRTMFARMRLMDASHDLVEQIDEVVELLASMVLRSHGEVSTAAGMTIIHMMVENGSLCAPVAEGILAHFGAAETSQLGWMDTNVLLQVQAGLLNSGASLDIAHAARFTHLFELIVSSGLPAEQATSKAVEAAVSQMGRPDLAARWQAYQVAPSSPMQSGSPFSTFSAPAGSAIGTSRDHFDPYASSTDFKGSAVIADELDKTYGKHVQHLNEALAKFKNMRRAGRHPRYSTYAKLIAAAAKEHRLGLAQEILAMARQDVPLQVHVPVVHNGWVAILDSMVAACLTLNKRDLAKQFHQELLSIGAAPSANTYGLYITTLKETTKTFDEATEAVKIFQQAKAEGVVASSFLYNALIGKLGKARRIDDCLLYFGEMRNSGIRPTSVTYGTVVNALCRVSDDNFAEELFEEMESMPNYKPRPAPYNSLMQYFLTTKRDRSKVLAYYQRMKARRIEPTMHTYKLLVDAYASIAPVDMAAAEGVLEDIRRSGASPEPVHYAALIHAKGCVMHDIAAARSLFDEVISKHQVAPTSSLYQALFESYVANHEVAATEALLHDMPVAMTPYIANTLIHGWATAGNITKARAVYDRLGLEHREPSTYEAMARAYIANDSHGHAMSIVGEALRRGYPNAVANKICELVSGGQAPAAVA